VKCDRVVLILAKRQMANLSIPDELLRMQRLNHFEFLWVDQAPKTYTKWVGAMAMAQRHFGEFL
jgi:hypothetical protein